MPLCLCVKNIPTQRHKGTVFFAELLESFQTLQKLSLTGLPPLRIIIFKKSEYFSEKRRSMSCALSSMRLLIITALLVFSTRSVSQDNGLIKLVFKDKSNFEITTLLGNKKPAVYFVLSKTDKWNMYRFHLDEDLTSDSVRKKLASDEHSPYNHSYLFRDTALDLLFNETEKQYLHRVAQSMKPRQLTDTFHVFKLIKSFNTAKNGFFFSVTDPVFTQNKQYAFIDITIFKKEKETEDFNHAYFGTTLLVYEYIKKKGWSRIKKRDYLIL